MTVQGDKPASDGHPLAGRVALVTGASGGIGQPDEVASLALAVLGNGYLTNQVIGLDGGMYPR